MKFDKFLVIATAVGLVTASGLAKDKITLKDLPPKVQQRLQKENRNGDIKEVFRDQKNGKTIYQISFSREGKNPVLIFREDGSIVEDSRQPGESHNNRRGLQRDGADGAQDDKRADQQRGTPEELPKASQNVRQAGTGKPAGAEKGQGIASAPRLSYGVDFNDLPPLVREAALQHGQREQIVDIDKETVNGADAYEFEFELDGTNYEVTIGANGRVLKDEKARRAPASTQQR